MSHVLQGTIAVVTGGSGGVGQAGALGLGAAGATVSLTGHTVHEDSARGPGTIPATAEAITRLGGCGVAVCCDHRHDTDVEALFRRVQEEQGRLDLLVNNVCAMPPEQMPVGVPVWQLPMALWDHLHTVGRRAHYVASVYAAPLLVAHRGGLIVNLSAVGAARSLFNVAYGVGKAGVDKRTADMAYELRPHGITVLSVWPSVVNTTPLLADADAPQLTGRAVAALAAAPQVLAKTGKMSLVTELAAEDGVTDLDGGRPPWSPRVAALRAWSRCYSTETVSGGPRPLGGSHPNASGGRGSGGHRGVYPADPIGGQGVRCTRQ
jgi:dehydrogenase/reductase SDR family member 1